MCCSAGFLTFNLHPWFIPHKVLNPLDRKEHAFPAYHPRLGARQGFKDIHRAQVHQVATAFMNKSSGSVHENVQGYDDAPYAKTASIRSTWLRHFSLLRNISHVFCL